MVQKIVTFDVALKSTERQWVQKVPEVYTNDLGSVSLQFRINDCTDTELTGSTAIVLLKMRDGSFFQGPSVDVTRTLNVFSYTLKENEGNHDGLAEIQLIVTIDAKEFATQKYNFKVISGLDSEVAREIMIYDWLTLTAEARAYIDQFTADELLRDAEFDNNQFDRNVAFNLAQTNRQNQFSDLAEDLTATLTAADANIAEFDVALETGIIAANLAEKLEDFESTYAPEIVSIRAQLADTLNKSAITLTHMFADATARDAYFVANPTELIELQFIKVGTGYQQYIEGVWTDSVPIVSEQLSATNQPIVDTGNYFATDNTNAALQELGAHKASTANPHGVTKAQVGLGNADNTSDANKPVSTAQQTALNAKANKVQEAWITPTLLNGWVQHTSFVNVGYMKDDMGFVHFRGGVSSGAIATLLLTLPSGYRQVGNKLTYHRIASSNGLTEVEINHSTGGLRLSKDTGTWYDLNAITFKV